LRGANGSRERAPDDRLRDEAIHSGFAAPWIASLALAMTVVVRDESLAEKTFEQKNGSPLRDGVTA
jgi:hypothetical protein